MKKHFALAVFDFIILLFTSLFTYWIITGENVCTEDFIWVFSISAVSIAVLSVDKFYKYRIVNSSFELFKGALVPMVLIFVLCFLNSAISYGFNSIYTRWVLINVPTSFGIIMLVRVFYRIFKETNRSTQTVFPSALVVGAGELGSSMARQASRGKFNYRIVGFLDDKKSIQGEVVIGYPVLGTLDDLEKVLSLSPVDTVLIAITNLSSDKIHKITTVSKKYNSTVKIIPSLFEPRTSSDVSVRDIDYSDLLGRKLITTEKEPLFAMFQQKTILVTGAGGSIGSEICRQLMEFGPQKLIVLDIDETELHDLCLRLLDYEHEWSEKVVPVVCDIKNAKKIEQTISTYKPDIIFHAAAYKHVPLMELFPEEAILTNIAGSYNVFNSARANKVDRVVVISSDKAVNPTNVMGATKRVVEMMAATFNKYSETDFCCVRFGNVIGSRGSMLPLFLEEIKAGKPITVTDRNIIRYFMAIPEAVSLVFRAATLANGGEVMVLDMGEPVNIYDFAKKLIDVFGDSRSSIRITGLRPGEKLYEELLANKDNTIPTTNEKIFKAKVRENDSWSKESLEMFIDSLPNKSTPELVEILAATVPEYHKPERKQ